MARTGRNQQLTDRQRRFVAEYLKDLNATQAAIRAGYSAKSAGFQGYQLLQKTPIASAIQEKQARHLQAKELTAELVDQRVKEILDFDPADIFGSDGCPLPIHQIPPHVRQAIASIEVDEIWEGRGEERTQIGVTRKIRFWSKTEMATLAAKRLGLLAAMEHRVSGTIEHRVAEMSGDERHRRAAEIITRAQLLLPAPANAP